MKIAGYKRHKTSAENRFWCMLDIWGSKPQSATRKALAEFLSGSDVFINLPTTFAWFSSTIRMHNDPEIKQICTGGNKLFLHIIFLGLGIEHILTTVFIDTQLWKTKHPWKGFQNFRQSFVLSTDWIENPPITATGVTF